MREVRSLNRLETFSDGVLAIAITLLVLEIKVPRHDTTHSVNELVSSIIQLWPSYFAFAFSFGGILVQWIIHHNIFGYLDKTSRPFLYANGFLMLTVVFIPFPTALLAEYLNTEYSMPAIVFYGMTTVVNALGWFLFIRTIEKPRRLTIDASADKLYDRIKKSNRLALIIYSFTTLLAIWFPYLGLIINIALYVLWVSISLIEKEDVI